MRLLIGVIVVLPAGCTETLSVLAAPEQDRGRDDAGALEGGAGGDVRSPPVAMLVTDVACGETHTCAIRNGELFCFGDDSRGAVSANPANGLGAVAVPRLLADLEDAVAVTAGESFSCALAAAGTVTCWGENGAGQLGAGATGTRSDRSRVALPAPALTLSAEFSHACAILSDQRLYCWGENREGQLGLDDLFPGMPAPTPVRSSPADSFDAVAAGQGHTCAIRSSGALACWGRNTDGQLGIGLSAGIQLRSAQTVGTDADWFGVASSQGHTCGLRAPGTLWCWGHNAAGQLGTGDTLDRDVPVRVGTDDDWDRVSIHAFGGCGLRRGALYCWGRNVEGQLGTGDTRDRLSPARVGSGSDWERVSVGRFHTCAVKRDGTLWCTGENVDGRLGTGDFDRRNTLSLVMNPSEPLQ